MTVKFVGVVGSGMMGSGIAEVVARAGIEVVLRGRTQSSADAAFTRVTKSLGGLVDKGKMPGEERDAILDRVQVTTDLVDLELCDIVVESVVEDLKVKQELFRELDKVCAGDAILATNTSTLPVGHLALSTDRPERVVGVHFFNPAPRMPLVEIIPAHTTAAETVDVVRKFAEDCGKETVTAKDRAGFIVNALLFPYLNGAVQMLTMGTASREDIDAAMRGGCGLPMGPLELLDLIGLDTSVAILNALHEERRDPCTEPARLLTDMVSSGHLGRKTRQGFYQY